MRAKLFSAIVYSDRRARQQIVRFGRSTGTPPAPVEQEEAAANSPSREDSSKK
jgi:hypothetical protein